MLTQNTERTIPNKSHEEQENLEGKTYCLHLGIILINSLLPMLSCTVNVPILIFTEKLQLVPKQTPQNLFGVHVRLSVSIHTSL